MLSSLLRPVTSASALPAETCRFVIGAGEAARQRFAPVDSHVIRGAQAGESFSLTVVLPLSYAARRRCRYPLLLLADGENLLGSAIEMQRVLAATGEAREGILVCHDDPWLTSADAAAQAARLAQIVEWCRERYRVQGGEIAFFAQGRAMASAMELRTRKPAVVDRWIVADHHAHWASQRGAVSVRPPPESTAQGAIVPALNHGILQIWGTGRAYGKDTAPLGRPLVSAALQKLRPLIRRLRRGTAPAGFGEGRNVLYSAVMDRDFEIFVSLPRRPRPGGRYPAVLALDANTTWSCVSEIAARMAQAGEIEDLITIGIGTPVAEGDIAFGLRRFEELSPPAGDEAFQGELGRFFLSIFALFGRDARQHFGRAPQFHRFLRDELLPELLRSLPIDPARMTLVGHSAAGTYAAYELAQPDTPFAGVAALSPGVCISDSWMLKADGGLAAQRRQAFVAIGGAERDNAFNQLAGIPLAERYAESLARTLPNGWVDYHCLEGETHTTVFARAYALLLARRFS